LLCTLKAGALSICFFNDQKWLPQFYAIAHFIAYPYRVHAQNCPLGAGIAYPKLKDWIAL
jgi:hypothetical protein